MPGGVGGAISRGVALSRLYFLRAERNLFQNIGRIDLRQRLFSYMVGVTKPRAARVS